MKITKNNKERFLCIGVYAAVDAELVDIRTEPPGCILLSAWHSATLQPTHARKLGQWLIAAADRLEEMRK